MPLFCLLFIMTIDTGEQTAGLSEKQHLKFRRKRYVAFTKHNRKQLDERILFSVCNAQTPERGNKPRGRYVEIRAHVRGRIFSSDELDRTKWRSHHVGMRRGGYWVPEQSFIEDGMLHIRTEYRSDGPNGAAGTPTAFAQADFSNRPTAILNADASCPRHRGFGRPFG